MTGISLALVTFWCHVERRVSSQSWETCLLLVMGKTRDVTLPSALDADCFNKLIFRKFVLVENDLPLLKF